jgi:putative ABC transport system permease protein
VRGILTWLTDAALADSILGDLYEGRRRQGALWFGRAAAGVVGYIAWRRLVELAAGGGGFRRGLDDARQALRALRRRPGFALGAMLLLALGIGANTAVFSVVRAVLLRPLPYSDPERLVVVWGGIETQPNNWHSIMTGQHIAAIGQRSTLLDSFAVVESWDANPSAQADLVGPNGAERLRGMWVTPNFFEILGIRAARGRTFASADREPGAVVISDALWRRRFAADPGIVGQSLRIAAGSGSRRTWSAVTVAGVLPAEFRFTYPRETEIYLLRPWTDIRPTRALTYYAVARLEDGVTPAQAQAELTGIARDVVRGYGMQGADLERLLERTAFFAEPVKDHLQAETRSGLWLLSAVAGLVLLIACVNLGLLLLSRTVDRRGELGVRAALGAGRARIVRQLAAECVMLTIAGGTAGVLTAWLTLPIVRELMPPIVPRADLIRLDSGVLAFAGATMLVTAFICSLAPSLFVVRRDLLATVRMSSQSATGDRGVVASRRAVLVLQVAVVVLLLVSSGLLLRSFWRLQNVDLGFRAEGIVTMEMRLWNPKYRQPGRLEAFREQLVSNVRGIPGVARAGLTTSLPMRGTDATYFIGPEGQRALPGALRMVDPDYFKIMQLRLLAGRTFLESDTANSEPVVVVSESYGRRYFGNASPLGRTLKSSDRVMRIVGVVADVRYASAARPPMPSVYLAAAQERPFAICLVVEPKPGARGTVVDALRQAVQAIDPEQPVERITTIDQILSESTADRRFYAVATGAFASVALLMAIAGVFGVVARTVSERRRELAIRVALGADARRLRRLVYGYGLVPAGMGTLAGLAAASAGSRFLRGFLFEVAPTDAATYAGTTALVLVVTAAACYLPARRTLRVQPMAVLKSD